MASVVDVCNLALQKLGAKRISALTDQTPSARACNLLYTSARQAELRKYDWNFAIQRVQLAADVPAPAWGRQNSFTLPSDYIKLTNDYPEDLTEDATQAGITVAFTATFTGLKDWVIEGKAIITNDESPLNVRYIADITDTTMWDSLFVKAVATCMAFEMCEELTQSNTKKESLAKEYEVIIEMAKKQSSIEVAPADPPPDTWIACRN